MMIHFLWYRFFFFKGVNLKVIVIQMNKLYNFHFSDIQVYVEYT